MAVIRQKRQATSRGIGVVRANTGSAQMWQSVSGLADNLIEDSFNKLKTEAVKKGKSVAEAVSAEKLATIDPVTGKPEAFEVPQGFGTAAQEAYDAVVKNRFSFQVEQDLKLKAAELAVGLENDPDSVEKFEEAFSAFVDGYGGSANVDPSVGNLVTDISTGLLASNKLNLMQKRMVKQREAIIEDFGLSIDSATSDLLAMTRDGIGDPASSEKKILENIQSHLDSQYITEKQAQEARRSVSVAKAGGVIRRIQRKLESEPSLNAVAINEIGNAILQNRQDISSLPESIQDDVREIQAIGNAKDGTSLEQISAIIAPTIDTVRSEVSAKNTLARQEETDKQRENALTSANEKYNALSDTTTLKRNYLDDAIGKIQSGNYSGVSTDLNELRDELISKKATDGSPLYEVGTVNNLISNMRQGLIDELITTGSLGDDGSFVSAETFSQFSEYVSTDGRSSKENLSEKQIAIADSIIEVKDESADNPTISSQIGERGRKIVANDQSNQLTKSQEDSIGRISGGRAKSSNRTDTDNIGQSIDGGLGVEWYTNPQNLNDMDAWKGQVLKSNAFPSGLVDLGTAVISGRGSNQQVDSFIQYYTAFARVQNRDNPAGEPINMWANGVFDDKEVAMMETAINAARFAENPAEEFARILSVSRSVMSDGAEYKNIERTNLGKNAMGKFVTVTDVLEDIVGDDYHIIGELEDAARYAVAGGSDRKKLTETMTNIYNNYYAKTDGVVIGTRGKVTRSRNSLPAMIPDALVRDRVVHNLNKMLKDTVVDNVFIKSQPFEPRVDDTATMSAEDMRLAGEPTRLYLQPLPFAGKKGESVDYVLVEETTSGMFEPYMDSLNGMIIVNSLEMESQAVEEIGQKAIEDSIAQTEVNKNRDKVLKNLLRVINHF